MKVAGSYTFEASRSAVWEALQDPTVLTGVLPGCERLDEVADGVYEGEINIRVGPVQGKFQGRVEMRDRRAPEAFTLALDGTGSSGFVKATADVRLEEAGDGTLMHYDSDAQVGGRIASVGQRLLDSSAKSIIRQSLDGLHATMRAGAASGSAAASGEAAPAYTAPSQAEFAAKVAKDVARDLIPKPVLIGALIVIALLVLWLLLG